MQVLLIEDDPMVRKVQRHFLKKIEGVEVVGEAENGVIGIKQLMQLKPDLILLDLFMPVQDGMKTLQQIRELAISVDVIVVTAGNDMLIIERMMRLGIFDYIVKPFSFERIKQSILRYSHYKKQITLQAKVTQQVLDQLLHPICETSHDWGFLPKGLNSHTLAKIICYLEGQSEGATAVEVAQAIGVARVTARRYLDYLEKQHRVRIDSHYGRVGRPVNQYFPVKQL